MLKALPQSLKSSSPTSFGYAVSWWWLHQSRLVWILTPTLNTRKWRLTLRVEFRRHRTTNNPVHIIGFLSQWKMYLDELPTTDFKGKKLDPTVFEKVSKYWYVWILFNFCVVFRCLRSNWDSYMSSCTLLRTCGSPLGTISHWFLNHNVYLPFWIITRKLPRHLLIHRLFTYHSGWTELKIRWVW